MALSGDTGDDAHPDDPFLLMFNAWWEPIDFSVPEPLRNLGWQLEIDTADPEAAGRVVDTSSCRAGDRTLARGAARHPARHLTSRRDHQPRKASR